MAQLAAPEPNEEIPPENKQEPEALCPFYGSSAGCSYLHNCPKSHSNPNSIELCNLYQTYSGCPNPSSCLYRHSLKPLTNTELTKLCKKHNISGKIHYTRIIKGTSVHRVIIIINQILWYGIHFIIEDKRIQKIHYEKYSSIYHWTDAILVCEIICEILVNSATPGKYLSYLKNLIDGDNEKNNNKNAPKKLIHYRDILTSIGNNFNKIPKPINPHIVANLSRVPWKDFKLFQLLPQVYNYPNIMLKPGDIVRIWRPKKFVYHCGIYLGENKIIHISNGIQGDQGMNWRISGLFQSGSSPNNSKQKHKQYYDYGKKIRNQNKNENKIIENIYNIEEYYNDNDDMDLVNENDEEKDIIFRKKDDIREEKEIELLYQNIDEFECKTSMDEIEMENARRARLCNWKEFILGSRQKDLELGFFIFPWRTYDEIVYTAQFLTEIHYMKGQYSVYKNNCEHFALYCCTGLRYSPQANRLEKVMNITNKITSFANNMFNKATSFRNNNNQKKNENQNENENENNNRNKHPIIQNKHIDDGGDEELEKLLLNNDNINAKKNEKNGGNHMEISQEFDIIYNDKNNNKKNNNIEDIVLIDEYANDEEDVLAESIIIETNENIKKDLMDMTPGGLTQSEILYAKKHNKWNV